MKIKLTPNTLLISVSTLTALLLWGIWQKIDHIVSGYCVGLTTVGIIHRAAISTLINNFLEKRHFTEDQLDFSDFSLKPRDFSQRLAIALHALITKVKEISLAAPTTFIVFFFFAALGLVWYRPELIDPNGTTFKDGVIPNLFVFTLDGLLIAGLFGYFSAKDDKRKKEQFRLVIRSFLARYMVKTAYFLKPTEGVDTLLKSEHAPIRVLNRLSVSRAYCTQAQLSDFSLVIKKMASGDATQAAALLTIAASLSPSHAELWFSVVKDIQALADSTESSWMHPLIDVLGSLINLDEMNFKGEKMNLNAQQIANLR